MLGGLLGLLERTLRETWRMIALTCLALAAVMGVFVQILPQFQEGLNEFVLQVPFLRTLISGLMGIDVSEGIAPEMLLMVVWSHPVVLSIAWGLQVALGTRVPAGEIEHGTIDVTLSWPVSRRALYCSEALVSLGGGVLLLASGLMGFLLGGLLLPPELTQGLNRTLYVVVNLFAVHVAVGGIVQCFSAACDRRGQAMGLAVAVLLASFLVSFLATLWKPAAHVAFLSFVHYYQPAQVMLTGRFPLGDVAVLSIVGASLWVIGGVIWSRRSVLTI